MKKIHKILFFLEGKKAVILAISSAIISYLVAGKVIDSNFGALLQTIISALFGGAAVASNTGAYREFKIGTMKK